MKKTLLLSALFALLGLSSKGQITINQADFTYVPKTFDQTADSLSVVIPATGASKTWNLSGMQKIKGRIETTYGQVSNLPGITDATEQAFGKTQFGPIVADINSYYQKSSDGYHMLGIGYDAQAYSLGMVSGDPNDSMFIPKQLDKFPSKRTWVKFPLTMGTNWNGQYVQSSTFLMTIAALGYNKTPWMVVSYVSYNSSVDGWGDCMIPNKGNPSAAQPSLLLKTETVQIDSFFINGSPGNPLLLGAIGVTQGDTTRTYEYDFYRKNGGIQSLANIQFTDNSYSKVDKASYSAEFDAMGIKDLNSAATLYPNPSTTGSLQMTLENTADAASILVTDITGRQVQASMLPLGNGTYEISVPGSVAQGVYFLQVFDSENNKLANSKFILNR